MSTKKNLPELADYVRLDGIGKKDSYLLGRIVALENAVRQHYHHGKGVRDNILNRSLLAQNSPLKYIAECSDNKTLYKNKTGKTHLMEMLENVLGSLSDAFVTRNAPLLIEDRCAFSLGKEHQLRYIAEYRRASKTEAQDMDNNTPNEGTNV